MDQPTEERIRHLEEEQKRLREEHEEMKRRLEQRTEEIKAVRVEVASEDVSKRLSNLEQGQEAIKEDTNIVRIQMQGTLGDILQLKESQADMRDRLIEHGEDLKAIKRKQDDHSEVLGQLITVGEGHTARFDRIDANMANKDDIKNMATKDDISRMELMMQEILKRLPPR